MKSHSWTSENDRLLQELWPYMINRDIAARLGCTTDTVAIKARKLGLTKSDKSHVYHERVAVAHRNAALADGRRPPKKRQDWKPAWTPGRDTARTSW